MSTINQLLVSVCLLGIFVLGFLTVRFWPTDEQRFYAQLKCPDEYTDFDAQMADLAKFNFYWNDRHPGASLGDWARGRVDFYRQKNCTAALQRYEEASEGKADPILMEPINAAIQEALTK